MILIDGTKITTHSDHIGRAINGQKNFYEIIMLDYIRKMGKKSLILDCGANIGNHSIFFAKYCADKVVAVEPIKENIALIEKNILDNGIENIEIIKGGLGKTTGKALFKTNPSNMGNCNLKPDPKGSIDIFAPEDVIKERFDLVKIDCEAMSGEVFQALLPMIKEYRADVFIEGSVYEATNFAKAMGGKVGRQFNATPTFHLFYDKKS